MFDSNQVPSRRQHTSVSLTIAEIIHIITIDINIEMRFVSEIRCALDDKGRIRWRVGRMPRHRSPFQLASNQSRDTQKTAAISNPDNAFMFQ